MPTHDRHHTAQLVKINNKYFLVDCGEGTQLRLVKYRVKFNKIDHIMISHLHGDHFFGLIGLLSTMHLQGRKKELQLFGPRGLEEIITVQLRHTQTFLNYKINFRQLDPLKPERIYEDDRISIDSIPLNHKIDCTGFVFREKEGPRRINKRSLPGDITLQQIAMLKSGKDITNGNGHVKYKNEALTLNPKRARSYAYCSDTCYDERILPQIKDVDVLYHEATFMNPLAKRARETFHSTAEQAATIASKAEVGKLLIGHFSTRYRDLTPILDEARSVFENVLIAEEGVEYEISG